MESNSSGGGSGIGVLGALGVLFVALKLFGVIDWSWWLVTLPFWGGFVLAFFVFAVLAIFAVINFRKAK